MQMGCMNNSARCEHIATQCSIVIGIGRHIIEYATAAVDSDEIYMIFC